VRSVFPPSTTSGSHPLQHVTQALHASGLQHVVQHHLNALYEGDTFRVGVEAANVLGVEQLNGSGGAALVPGCSVDTDASDTFAGDFVKYSYALDFRIAKWR
jgi:hypothetical protein